MACWTQGGVLGIDMQSVTFRFRNFSVSKLFSLFCGFGFGIEKSIGFGIVKKLVSEKVLDLVSKKFGIRKSFGFGFVQIFGIVTHCCT